MNAKTSQFEIDGGGPRIVAIETSGRQGSVVVAVGGRILEERVLSATSRHAVELMPTIEAMVKEVGWRADMIEHMYLSLGPGSFTGLRIAVAVVRGMAQAIGCKVVGIPSLEVIAQNATEGEVVVPMLDAKRGEVFAARYERDGEGRLVQKVAAKLVDPVAFLRSAVAESCGKVAVLGEGIAYHGAAMAVCDGVVELSPEVWAGRAREVHRLGWERASRGEFSDVAKLLPIYIRLPEAEEVWRKRHGVE